MAFLMAIYIQLEKAMYRESTWNSAELWDPDDSASEQF